MSKALILTFHGIQSEQENESLSQVKEAERYTLTPNFFNHILRTIPKTQCCNVAEFSRKKEGHWIIPTFDDGLISDYEQALPALQKNGLSATFYVTENNIGQKGYCDKQQIRELSESGMEIGSHGLTHRYLISLSRNDAHREICDSKSRLEDMIGREVVSFAAVGGHYRNWMKKVIWECGYKTFATMIPGNSKITSNLNVLRRNHIQANHSNTYVDRLLNEDKKLMVYNKVRFYSLYLMKRALGINGYDGLKGWIENITKTGRNK